MKNYYEAIEGSGGQIDWQKEYSKLASQLTAKEAEIKELKGERDAFEYNANQYNDQITELQAELKYQTERCEAAEKLLESFHSSSYRSDDMNKWQALKNQKPNDVMQSNGASQEKPNSTTDDDKINEPKHTATGN